MCQAVTEGTLIEYSMEGGLFTESAHFKQLIMGVCLC